MIYRSMFPGSKPPFRVDVDLYLSILDMTISPKPAKISLFHLFHSVRLLILNFIYNSNIVTSTAPRVPYKVGGVCCCMGGQSNLSLPKTKP